MTTVKVIERDEQRAEKVLIGPIVSLEDEILPPLTAPAITCAGDDGTLLASKLLGTFNTKFLLTAPNSSIFKMLPRKSQRNRKPRTVWEEKRAPSAASDLKITEKTARIKKKTALKLIITRPLPTTIDFDEAHLPELSIYKLSLKLQFQRLESLATGLSEL
jgi:hypothetical protein